MWHTLAFFVINSTILNVQEWNSSNLSLCSLIEQSSIQLENVLYSFRLWSLCCCTKSHFTPQLYSYNIILISCLAKFAPPSPYFVQISPLLYRVLSKIQKSAIWGKLYRLPFKVKIFSYLVYFQTKLHCVQPIDLQITGRKFK